MRHGHESFSYSICIIMGLFARLLVDHTSALAQLVL